MRRIGDDIGSTEYVIMLYDIKVAFYFFFLALVSPPPPFFLFVFSHCFAAPTYVEMGMDIHTETAIYRDGLLIREGGASIPVRLMSEPRNAVSRELRGAVES